ncbi:hypothetical protein B0H11DRAFT_1952913 [Mycena galericulata]|nr:hypothetical protein B0H11DRAFT_1952913 [Mycena galericulata]
MTFRKDRARVVLLSKYPHGPGQYFNQAQLDSTDTFLKLPIVQKNVVKLDIAIANTDVDQTLQSLGISKPPMNSMVVVEAESMDKIHDIARDSAFQKMFEGDKGNHPDGLELSAFSADFTTMIDLPASTPQSTTGFRKDRIRLVILYNAPRINAQNFANQSSDYEALDAFLKLPTVQKNILKLDVALANAQFDQALQSLGIQKSAMNIVTMIEVEVNDTRSVSFPRYSYLA